MIWRPFTQEKTAEKPVKIIKGDGIWLYDESGKRYADMISSWWVTAHGHGNKEIAAAIAQQASTLEQVILTAFTHQPAETLVERLKTVLSPMLKNFFFSDNGSTAVEVALKIAYQYFKNKGDTRRKRYLCLEGAYHGDTYGAMSVSGKNSMYHFNFAEFFFDTLTIPVPETYESVQDLEASEDRILKYLEKQLQTEGFSFCALIVEPLIQGARGMVMYRPQFLEKLVKLVRKFGILVIFDEVFTGFYRTGRFFAMDYLSEKPDIVCLSKALTGGFLPLSLTIATDEIYKAFLSDNPKKALIHGHSYTGNPIACAAACKSLEIFMRPETRQKVATLEQFYRSQPLEGVTKRRTHGLVNAFDVASPQTAKRLVRDLFERGIFMRPLGSTLYVLPPLCVTTEELEWVYDEIQRALKSI